jgi:Cytochrome P450
MPGPHGSAPEPPPLLQLKVRCGQVFKARHDVARHVACGLMSVSAAATCAGVLLFALVVWYQRNVSHLRHVPGPAPRWLFGNMALLNGHSKSKPRNLTDVYSELASRFGPIFRFVLGSWPVVVVTGPRAAQVPIAPASLNKGACVTYALLSGNERYISECPADPVAPSRRQSCLACLVIAETM